MKLNWIEGRPETAEGERFHLHYLVDMQTEQCFATIAEPRKGNILYETDLRVQGRDRSFITLAAAQAHCEWSAVKASIEDAKEFEKEALTLEPQSAAPAVLTEPVAKSE
jgi:hypothetical protein